MRITIGIVNFNYARFLRASIDSALTQLHDDLEIVVVDDGSTDESAAIISSYGDRVHAVMQDNGGQAAAMNTVFAHATGDAVVFLDADDALAPRAAATIAEMFQRHPDTAWLMWRLALVDDGGADLGRIRPHRTGVMPNADLRRHLARWRCFHWQPTSGNAFARSALAEVMPIPVRDYRMSADAYLANVVPLCGPVRSVDDVLGQYRLHGSNNFAFQPVDESYFRGQIARQQVSHGHALHVAARLGVDLPADVRDPRDAAFLAFRMSSLLLDHARHPYPDDTRRSLARQGVIAALGNRQLGWRNRFRRAAWFAACGFVRQRSFAALVSRAPDTPAQRATLLSGQMHAVA